MKSSSESSRPAAVSAAENAPQSHHESSHSLGLELGPGAGDTISPRRPVSSEEIAEKAQAVMGHIDTLAAHLEAEQKALERSLKTAFEVTKKELTAETQRRREK